MSKYTITVVGNQLSIKTSGNNWIQGLTLLNNGKVLVNIINSILSLQNIINQFFSK